MKRKLSTTLWTAGALVCVWGSALEPVAALVQTPPRPELTGNTWQLVKFQGGDDRLLTPDDRTKYTLDFLSDGALQARIDCNRGRSTWTSASPSQLQLGPLALTRALCPEGSMHDQIVKQWPFVRSYVVKDGHLFLSLMADGGIYEFEPAVTKPTLAAAAGKQGPAGQALTLEGPVWRLTHLAGRGDQDLAALTRPATIRFDAGHVQAFTGCNSVAGSYSVDKDRVTLGKLIGTLMACAPSLMAVESAFNKALVGTLTARIIKNELSLSAESDSSPTLVFVAQAPPAIEDISWEVTLLDNGRQALATPLPGSRLTMLFKDGAISGSAGCNTFQGKYSRQDNRLTIGPVAATRKFCAEDGVMDQERRFLEALEAAASWAIDGNVLDLRRANATGLVRAQKP